LFELDPNYLAEFFPPNISEKLFTEKNHFSLQITYNNSVIYSPNPLKKHLIFFFQQISFSFLVKVIFPPITCSLTTPDAGSAFSVQIIFRYFSRHLIF